MPYILIENLSAGVDRRRPIYASKQGSLWEGINGHLTRGGDFEKRKAFVSTYTLPAGTFGMQTQGNNLYVFGSGVDPGVPAGVNYQRLQHPDGLAMTAILWSTLFDGKIYAIAEYTGNAVLHFYDGVLIEDWIAGKVRAGMTNNDGIAEHLKTLINTDIAYIATRSGAVITITASVAGVPFTISATTENGGAIDNQSVALAQTVANVSGGTEVLSSGSFRITGGTSSPGVNKISSVKVDGIEILSTAVDWTTSNSNTATLVASQINTFTSTPNYTASVSGGTVNILAASGSGAGPNGFVVAVTADGDVTVGDITNMSGGVAGTSNVAQVYTATIGGTFEANDKFTITIDGKRFGAQDNPLSIARSATTHKNKIYAPAGSVMNYSGVALPMGWNATNDIGAGGINMSNQDEGSANLTAVAIYQGFLAVMSRKTIQIWHVEADDANNTLLQTLRRTGTLSPGSVQSFGDIDVFYLDAPGVRSLRARDSSNSAAVNDVGTLVDTIVQSWVNNLTATQITMIQSIIEANDGRYWLAIGNKILVFSYFPGSKISGWTWYEPGFSAEWFADPSDNTGPWVRSGNTIYKYGGSNNATYDSSVVTCWLPFIDGSKPGHFKQWAGFDLLATNTWNLDILVDPEEFGRKEIVGEMDGFTLLESHTGAVGHWPMVSPKLTCSEAGYASISGLLMHYMMAESEAEN